MAGFLFFNSGHDISMLAVDYQWPDIDSAVRYIHIWCRLEKFAHSPSWAGQNLSTVGHGLSNVDYWNKHVMLCLLLVV